MQFCLHLLQFPLTAHSSEKSFSSAVMEIDTMGTFNTIKAVYSKYFKVSPTN